MAVAAPAVPSPAPPLSMPLRVNLSIMMFLQFAVWGAWFVVFFPYLLHKGFDAGSAGMLMSNMALGAVFSTLLTGYVADRFVASEKLMGVLHLVGAGFLYWTAQISSPADFWALYAVTLGYALLYNPTLALSNSIAFTHVPDGARDFPGLRVLGTLGWIVVGFLVDLLFKQTVPTPDGGTKVVEAFTSNGPLLLAAGLSAFLGVYSFFLPHTPPAGKSEDTIPFVKALGLFKDFSFAVFFAVSFAITIVLAFYYNSAGSFLSSGAGVKDVSSTMAIGQIAELCLLPFLPWFLTRFGMKWVLVLGMFCWGLRYFLFSLGGPGGLPFALVIMGVALHGVCFDFFFAAGFIHVDNEAPNDIRASGQALFSFLTYGLGMWLGGMLAGQLQHVYTDPVSKAVNWSAFWLIPSVGVLIAMSVFVVFFRIDRSPAKTTNPLPAEAQTVP